MVDFTRWRKIVIETDGPGCSMVVTDFDYPYEEHLFKYSKWKYVLEKLKLCEHSKESNMNDKLILTEENDKEDTNVTPIRLLTGGKGGEGNWLNNLEVGTCFICKPKPTRMEAIAVFLPQYEILSKEANNCVKLYAQLQQTDVWTQSHVFSLAHELITILGTVENE